ncbi:hypothetical protein IAT38_001245 [Cryptococcus sp. DSM 104549]
MSKKPTELEAAALTTGWGPQQQAALYHIHLAQQAEKDEAEALAKLEKKDKKARAAIRPDEVQGGEIVNDWIKGWCPALFDLLDMIAPPYFAIVLLIGAHFLFWYTTPWYLHFLLPWPTTYFVPLFCTFKSIRSEKDRTLWLSYWVIISVLEYIELLCFRDQARALIWWPKIKAIFCVVMYSIIDTEDILDSKGKPKDKKPIFGAIKLMVKFLPDPPKEKPKERDDKKKDDKKKDDKSKSKSSS